MGVGRARPTVRLRGASVGCAVVIASSLSYLYWNPAGGTRPTEERVQTAAKTSAKAPAKQPAPAPVTEAPAQVAATSGAVPLPDRKPQIADSADSTDSMDSAKTDVAALAPETGAASWYDFAGEETANGEIMDAGALTAAHPTLPFGTEVEVENVANGKTVIVRVNDRGPHADGRIIDVSEAAAEELGMIDDGVAEVRVEPVAQ